jgi:hypothetical protein
LNAMLELDKGKIISLFVFFIFKRLGRFFTEQKFFRTKLYYWWNRKWARYFKFTPRYTISDTISKLLPSKLKLKLFVGNWPPAKIRTFVLYLGVNFSRTGSYLNTKKRNIDKAYKAIYAVLKKGHLHNLSIKGQYDLFDKIVKPILLYGCEIWGFSNLDTKK